MGQLLVVLYVTPHQPSSCSEQSELIPGPWYVPDKLRTGARVLGSGSNVMEEPAVELPLHSGHFRMILKIILKKEAASNKLQASSLTRKNKGLYRMVC